MSIASDRFSPLLWVVRPILIVGLIVALGALAASGLKIRSEVSALRSDPADNLDWNLAQLEVDLVRLSEALHVNATDPVAPLQELRRRFDLFYSRAQNAITGQGYAPSGQDDLKAVLVGLLDGYIRQETPLIDGPDDRLRQSLPAMADRIDKLRVALHKTTSQMVERQARVSSERRAAFASLVRQLELTTIATILVFACLLALVIWLNRTASREADQIARLSRRLVATVDSALDAIIIIDSFGRILQYNPSAEAIFGFSRDEVMGREVAELIVPPHHRDAHRAGMERMRKTGQVKVVDSGRFQITALHRSGREFPIELQISTSEGDEGRIFIAFLRDISRRLAAETALTAARDEALAAEKAKTEFLAVMSHEMRTPLNGLIASLEIVRRQVVDPEAQRFVVLAQESANQLLRHANDVLDITRMESARMDLNGEDFDLADHLSRLVEAVRPICNKRHIALDFTMLTESAVVHADPFRLGQIVQNLLSNAMKFVDDGKGHVIIEAELTETAPDMRAVEIRVIDNGPGIAPEDQERIFQDFVMLDTSFRRSGQGAGLGLAISRRLAAALGGELGVESEPGEGSCFWLRLTLPVAKGAPAKVVTPVAGADLPSLDVLVVEDNPTNRAVLEEMLRHLGQRVVLAPDGASGAAAAAAKRFDLILMDISMPLMDGIAATRLIRAGGASSSVPIVAVTAHSMETDQDRFRAAGMDDVLVKPISTAALVALLSGRKAVLGGPPDAAPFDKGRLAELREVVGKDGLARLTSTFLRDGQAQKDSILAAATRGAAASELSALCHEAAGAAAVIGAMRLRVHYAWAEQEIDAGRLSEANAVLQRDTEAIWRESIKAMTDLIDLGPAHGDAGGL